MRPKGKLCRVLWNAAKKRSVSPEAQRETTPLYSEITMEEGEEKLWEEI